MVALFALCWEAVGKVQSTPDLVAGSSRFASSGAEGPLLSSCNWSFSTCLSSLLRVSLSLCESCSYFYRKELQDRLNDSKACSIKEADLAFLPCFPRPEESLANHIF